MQRDEKNVALRLGPSGIRGELFFGLLRVKKEKGCRDGIDSLKWLQETVWHMLRSNLNLLLFLAPLVIGETKHERQQGEA